MKTWGHPNAEGRIIATQIRAESPGDGWLLLPDGALPDQFYVDGEEVKPYTEAQRSIIKQRPSPFHMWDAAAHDWKDSRSPDLLSQHAEAEFRAERNRRLAASDWTQMPDVPLTPEQVAQWRVYRQALRDLTKQQGSVSWPLPPS